MTSTRKRSSSYGTGNIRFDEKTKLWRGRIYMGLDPTTGKPRMVVRKARRKEDLLTKMAAVQTDKRNGTPVVTGKLTVEEWMTDWLDNTLPRRVEPGTVNDYRNQAKRVIRVLGQKQLKSLTGKDVEDMMRTLKAEGLSPRTVKYSRFVLHRALKEAKAQGKVTTNVVDDTEGPGKLDSQAHQAFTEEEARKILKVLKDDRWYALAVLVLNVGLRPGEAYALSWADLLLDTGYVVINKTLKRLPLKDGGGFDVKPKPKTMKSIRTVPLPDNVVAVLRSHLVRSSLQTTFDPKGFVFTTDNGSPLETRAVGHWWERTLKAAGVPYRPFVKCRHTAATILLNRGVPLERVSANHGHAGYAITADVYAHVGDKLLRESASVMDDVFAEDNDEYHYDPDGDDQ